MQGWLLDWGRHSTFDNGAWFLARTIMLNLIRRYRSSMVLCPQVFPSLLMDGWIYIYIYYSKKALCMRIQARPTKWCTNT